MSDGPPERRPLYERVDGGWGRVHLGRVHVSARTAVVVVGGLMWLVTVVARTGRHGLVAFATNLLMVGILVLLASGTRSTTLRRVASLFFFGGVSFLGIIFIAMVVDPDKGTLGPLFEEVLKLSPLLVLLWLRRKDRTWSLGATDVLLLAAACGAGFAVLEDAHIRDRRGWAGTLALLPSSEVRIGGGVIVGHALWTALAGAGIGIALHFRRRMAVAVPVAAVAFLISVLDHIGLNSGSWFLGVITADGNVTLVALLAAVAACIVLDLRALGGVQPRPPELLPPPRGQSLAGLRATWDFVLTKRAALYAAHQHAHAPEEAREQPAAVTAAIASLLYEWHHGPPPVDDAS